MVIIVIGIAALIVAAVISILKSVNMPLLVCEGIALLCLIGALVAVGIAKSHIEKHEEKIRLNPYSTVDRKEIDKILDMISREEVRRKRSEDFAAGKDLAGSSSDNSSSSEHNSSANDSNDSSDSDDEDELTFLVIDDHEDDDASDAPSDNKSGRSDEPADEAVPADTEPDDSTENNDNSFNNADGEEDDDMNHGYDDYDDRAPRRRSQDGYDRRERDPYYDDYYDDRPRQRAPRDSRDPRDPYANRDRDGVYYNEYGEPVRRRRPAYDPYYDDYYADRPRQRAPRDSRDPRDMRDPRASRDPYASRDRDGVYYNEYGEPVRRRRPAPYDDRRQAQPRRRRPEDYPDGRPQSRYEDEEVQRRAPAAAPSVPSASAAIDDAIEVAGAPAANPASKAPDYDENYVPVVIPDDDYDYDAVRTTHTGRAGVGSLNRPAPARNEPPSVPSAYRNEASRADDRRYSGYDDDESIPVALPDDDYFENRYTSSERDSYRQAPPPAAPAAPAASSEAPRRTRDRYVPDYEDEEMVVSLPRDDEYESYVEKKREEEEQAAQQRLKEQRKAERKASGKIVLTIVKIRRRKIRRKSRKYKQFRASVHHLNEYLHSFSASSGS